MTFQKIEWTDDVIEEFWRYWSTRPEAYFTETLGDTIVRFAVSQLGSLGTVLDYGAGSGGLLAALSAGGHGCFGLDFGAESTARLRKRFDGDENVGGILGLAELSGRRESFDTVFLIETIEHLPDRHLMPALDAIHSVLKPGGHLIVSTPNDEDLDAAQIYCPLSRTVFHPMQHLRSWDSASLPAFLHERGFTPLASIECDIQARWDHSRSEWLKRRLKRMINRDHKDPHLFAVVRK